MKLAKFVAALWLAACGSAVADSAPCKLVTTTEYSALTHGRGEWKELAIGAFCDLDDVVRIEPGATWSDREGRSDAYYEAKIVARIDDDTHVSLSGGFAPDADYKPAQSIGAGITQRLFENAGWLDSFSVTADAKYAEYLSGVVKSLVPGLEVYALDGRLNMEVRSINVWDESGDLRSGYFVRAGLIIAERWTLHSGYADAPDTTDGVTIDTTSWFAGVAIALNEDVTLRINLSQELRDRGFDRTSVGLALTVSF